MEDGLTDAELFDLTKIDPWWIKNMRELFDIEQWAKTKKLSELSADDMTNIKQKGFSDSQLAR